MRKYKLSRKKIFGTGKGINKINKYYIPVVAGITGLALATTMISYLITNRKKTIDNKDNYEVVYVEPGDTLTKIAQENNTTIELLVKENNIENPNIIEVGQKIRIPNYVEEEKEQVFIDTEKVISNFDESLNKDGYAYGIDISQHQTNEKYAIDLNQVLEKNPQIKYVIARSNYFWIRDRHDQKINEYAEICKEKNVAFGIYYWPTFKNIDSTKKEIDIVMQKVKELENNKNHLLLPIFFDIETKDNGGGDLVYRIKENDKTTIECFEYAVNYFRENGYEVMIYTGENCSKTYGIEDLAKKHDIELWLAKYKYKINKVNITDDINTVMKKTDVPHVIRQYADTGKVVGYDYDIDLDLCYRNLPQEIIENKLNNTEEISKDENEVLKFVKNLFS